MDIYGYNMERIKARRERIEAVVLRIVLGVLWTATMVIAVAIKW